MARKLVDYVVSSCELITPELIERIEKARDGCSSLGIGVLSDEEFERKRHRKPLRPYAERAFIVSHLNGVDFVFKVEDEESIFVQEDNHSKTKQYHIGYAPGTYDLLHQGHIEHLTEAYSQCDILVVGINDDDLVESYKSKRPMMLAQVRANIVATLDFVDSVYIAHELERANANEWIMKKYGSGIDAVFIGSDWKGQDLHNAEGFKIVFTERDPEKMKTRSSSFYREEIRKNNL